MTKPTPPIAITMELVSTSVRDDGEIHQLYRIRDEHNRPYDFPIRTPFGEAEPIGMRLNKRFRIRTGTSYIISTARDIIANATSAAHGPVQDGEITPVTPFDYN